MDNLIVRKDYARDHRPVHQPGVVKGRTGTERTQQPQLRYDSLGDANARFVIDE
jgi:hypothetical protein